jgi:phosphatidylinositol glycan class B
MKLKYIYSLSILLLIITAFYSSGYYHFDEHFQILEFAGLKLNLTSAINLPWEYQYQMRPAIQPALVVLLYNIFNVFGLNNPFTITIFLRILSATIAFFGMYLIYKSYILSISEEKLKKWFIILSFFLWFMIFNNVRFSSENWSGSIFLIAFSLFNIKQSKNRLFPVFIGLLMGLSFLFRYQTGFLITGFILWHLFIKKDVIKSLFLVLGILIIIGVGIIIDRWFYGTWSITTWNYFNENILQNKISNFGIEPWWYYIEKIFIQAVPPFSLIFILSFFIVFIFKRKDLLTWTIFPFLLVHFFIGHKEIRFLFPLIGFLPIIIIKAFEIINSKLTMSLVENRYIDFFAKTFLFVNIIILLFDAFTPADNQISLYNKIYSNYKEPTTLYFIGDNPYHRVLDIYFYKRKNLEIKSIPSIEDIDFNINRKLLFVTKDKNILTSINAQKTLIYSTFPNWIRVFNLNHWIERANCWYVYELHPIKTAKV